MGRGRVNLCRVAEDVTRDMEMRVEIIMESLSSGLTFMGVL
jgi:hypothetical protein